MISPSLKSLVQRLLNDEEYREVFLRSPDRVLKSHAFSTEELRALLTFRTRLAAQGQAGQATIQVAMPWP
jgi:hypothetical protein